jgi:hypothetical protein
MNLPVVGTQSHTPKSTMHINKEIELMRNNYGIKKQKVFSFNFFGSSDAFLACILILLTTSKAIELDKAYIQLLYVHH